MINRVLYIKDTFSHTHVSFAHHFALCMLRLCSISADPGQGANAIGVEKEQIDDARGGRFFQTSMCPGERVVTTWVQVSSGFAGLVESDSDVKL